MIAAAELRAGMVVRLDGVDYRVLSAEVHRGAGKMKSSVHARLEAVDTGSQTDRRFRLEEHLEDLELHRRTLTYLYHDEDSLFFMDPETFEQIGLPLSMVGDRRIFLKEDTPVPVEFVVDRPVRVVLPEYAELQVTSTAPPMRQGEQSTWKPATLENGLEVDVPLFVADGDTIRIQVATRRYVERLRDTSRH